MTRNSIIYLVVIAAVGLTIVFLISTPTVSKYCNCSGMDKITNEPTYRIWEGSTYPSGYQTLNSTYVPTENTARDVYRDANDGLISGPSFNGCSAAQSVVDSTNAGVWPSAYSSRIVPLHSINAALPPGAVEDNRVSYSHQNPGLYRYGTDGNYAMTGVGVL